MNTVFLGSAGEERKTKTLTTYYLLLTTYYFVFYHQHHHYLLLTTYYLLLCILPPTPPSQMMQWRCPDGCELGSLTIVWLWADVLAQILVAVVSSSAAILGKRLRWMSFRQARPHDALSTALGWHKQPSILRQLAAWHAERSNSRYCRLITCTGCCFCREMPMPIY